MKSDSINEDIFRVFSQEIPDYITFVYIDCKLLTVNLSIYILNSGIFFLMFLFLPDCYAKVLSSRHNETGLPGAAQRSRARGDHGSSAYEHSCPFGAAGPPTTASDELQAVGAQKDG